MCRGRSPAQPCCFGVGAAASRVPGVDVCVFCDKDKLSSSLKDKNCVNDVLRRLKTFSNEVRPLYIMLCVYVTAQHACVLVIPREVFDKAVEFVPEDFQAIVGSKHMRSKRKKSNTDVLLAPAKENAEKSRRKWKAESLRDGEDKHVSPSVKTAAEEFEVMVDVATDWTIDEAKEAQTTVQKLVENVGDKKKRPKIHDFRQLFMSTPTSVLKHMDLIDVRSELAATDRINKKRSMTLLTTYQRHATGIVKFLSDLGSEKAAPAVKDLPLKSEPSDLQL